VLPAPSAAIDAIAADLARWRSARAALLADARADGDGDVIDRLTSLVSPEETAARRRLGGLLLLTLDFRLQHRLQASVAAALATTDDLTAATAARAWPALRRSGWSGDLADIELGSPPTLTSTTAVLPHTWMASVWGRNLAQAVAEHVVLDVTSVTPDGAATVLAARPGKPQVVIRVDQWENA
jgi:hypothetical protein